MSDNYTKVKKFYRLGVWTVKRVHDAVVQGWITEEEFEEITGESYE